MAKTLRKRPCSFCGLWFRPTARLKGKQYACGAAECQKQRKLASQEDWVARHPGAFRGRGEKHRAYRRARAEREGGETPAPRKKDPRRAGDRRRCAEVRATVEQDAIALQLAKAQGVDRQVLPSAEQDAIRAQACVLVGLVAQLPLTAEQDSIRSQLAALHDSGRRLLGGTHGRTRPD